MTIYRRQNGAMFDLLENARQNAPKADTRLTRAQVQSLAIFTSMAAMTHGATPDEAVMIAQVIRGEKHVVGNDILTVVGKLP